jgi:tetratricopeptide (TPR) repeat protein/tRNA A-37 threonylcarbamoyl transferase component Bud32
VDDDEETPLYPRNSVDTDAPTVAGDHPIVAPPDRSAASRSTRVLADNEVVADRYRIVRFIARGGEGEVYEAEDLEMGGDHVAIKTLVAHAVLDKDALGRFNRSARLPRQVTHENICQTYTIGDHRPAGTEEGAPPVRFIVMELLRGETLAQRLTRVGRLTTVQAFPIVHQVARALAALHEKNIVHRDLKPGNIFIEPGKRERVVVTDFGIAKRTMDTGTEGSIRYTETGMLVGTPGYMSPEQLRAEKELTGASDIYALGVVMFEMVTGRRPFDAEKVHSLITKVLYDKPPKPSSLVQKLDSRWDKAILACLEKKPEDRFRNAEDIIGALGGEPVPISRRYVVRRWIGASVAVAGLTAAGIVVAMRDPPVIPVNRPTSPPIRRLSLAVLGFKNLGHPEDEWRSTALAEILRNRIAVGQKLRTIPGETVTRAVRDLAISESGSSGLAPDTLQALHRTLGADFIVLGTYLVQSGKISIGLSLQDVRTGEVKAYSQTGAANDLYPLAAASGSHVRSELGLGELSEQEDRRTRSLYPVDLQAARAYSQGLDSLRVFDALAARDHLERAIRAEPGHPVIHSALASAWAALGYDMKARAEAKLAVELSKNISEVERRRIEAQYHEMNNDWPKAIETYKALQVVFPNHLEYGLALAAAQVEGGKGRDAFATITTLRALAAPESGDPRIDLAEAAAAKAVTDFERQRKAALAAGVKAQKLGAKLLLAQARLAEGSALVNMGRLEEAQKDCADARTLFEAAGDLGNAARAENIIAVAYAQQGDFERAKQTFEQSLRTFRRIGDQRGIAAQLANTANALVDLQRLPQARKLYQQALAVSIDIDDKSSIARARNNLGSVLELMNELGPALDEFELALTAYKSLEETRNEALTIANIGWVMHRQSRNTEAKKEYEKSLAISRRIKSDLDTAETLIDYAKVHDALGDLSSTRRSIDAALAIFKAESDPDGEARAYDALAEILEKRGQKGEAAQLKEKANRVAKQARAAA